MKSKLLIALMHDQFLVDDSGPLFRFSPMDVLIARDDECQRQARKRKTAWKALLTITFFADSEQVRAQSATSEYGALAPMEII